MTASRAPVGPVTGEASLLSPGLPPAQCQEEQSPEAPSPPPAPPLRHDPNLWLTTEVQSRKAIRWITKEKHQPSAVAALDSCPASTQKPSPEALVL